MFLKRQVKFFEIHSVIENAMSHFSSLRVSSFADIYEADKAIREYLKEACLKPKGA